MPQYKSIEGLAYEKILNKEDVLFNNKDDLSKVKKIREFLKSIDKNPIDLYAGNYSWINMRWSELAYFDGILLYKFDTYFLEYNIQEQKSTFLEYESLYMNAYNAGEYYEINTYVEKKFRPIVFNIFYNKMSNINKYKGFIEMHKTCEYGLKNIPLRTIKEIFTLIPKEIIESRKNSKLIDDDGYIKIYRGICSKSSRGNRALSWTSDIEIAKWFATRFNKKGKVLSGKIHINDIIFIFGEEMKCIDDGEDEYKDSEKEILVIPEKVLILEENEVFRD